MEEDKDFLPQDNNYRTLKAFQKAECIYDVTYYFVQHYLKTGDELPVRTRHHVPWGKMIKKSLIENHRIRFEEIKYSNDILFSVHVGCLAKKIEAIDTVLYVVTSHEGSATYEFCKKPDELRIRAGAAFRYDSFLFQHNMSQGREIVSYIKRMLSQDRNLFKYYFTRLDEIYTSKIAALKDITKGCSCRFKIKLYFYSFKIWISRCLVS